MLPLAALSLVAIVWWILFETGNYYELPIGERPHHAVHREFRPGGVVGHGLGIAGSTMIILLLVYSARKRIKRFRKWGKLSNWLNYHIFLGIAGPILVTFHTSFKFNGIVSIAYWSMVAVALSGFIGRYIYVKIPRRISGNEITASELNQQQDELTKQLVVEYSLSAEQIEKLDSIAQSAEINRRGLLGVFIYLYLDTIGRIPLRQKMHGLAKELHLSRGQIHHFYQLLRKKIALSRHIAFLSSAQKLFHYWHVIHRPFAYTMIVIMIIHTILAITFGYTWIW